MENNRKLTFYDERTISIVSSKGILKQIPVPFQVKCIQQTGIIKVNTIVYVEAVAEHQQFKIMYRVLNQWMPYNYFVIPIKI